MPRRNRSIEEFLNLAGRSRAPKTGKEAGSRGGVERIVEDPTGSARSRDNVQGESRDVRGILEFLKSDQRGEGGAAAEGVQSGTFTFTDEVTLASDSGTSDGHGYVSEASGYLMEVRYSGPLNRVVAFIYDPSKRRLLKWVDSTGHKPYLLVEKSVEELKDMDIDLEALDSFERSYPVAKFNPITRSKTKVYRVEVSDPLAVRKIRSRLEEKGVRYWEADIKYHLNYIYDNLLVPGMKYRVSKSWERLGWEVSERALKELESALEGEDRGTLEMAVEWLPLFEQPPPSMPRVSLDIEVYTPAEGQVPDTEKAEYPVISIALADNSGWSKVYLLYREDSRISSGDFGDASEVEVYDDELSMIMDALRKATSYPVVVTFNGDNFDLPYLWNRLSRLGVPREENPIEPHQDYYTFRDSLHVDLYKFFDIKALQVYAFGNKYRDKGLDAIASALIGVSKVELEGTVTEASLDELSRYNLGDARITIELTTFSRDLVWNLIVLLMRISKMGLEDVTRTQVSSWVRSLMNWEHRRRRWLIPGRGDISEMAGAAKSRAIIKEKKYQGAIVLTPPRGVFFNVLVLDFASLYPSIIKNWNLSYETVNNPHCKNYTTIPEVGHRVCRDFKGISSEIIGLLRDFRVKIYKRRAKDPGLAREERLWFDVAQSAMKVYINASYGVFGTEAFHLYSLPVAESVTAIGRTVLKETLSIASKLNLTILYGDTDSLFLWDPPKEELEKLVEHVERRFGLELEVDKTFRISLFSGLKKNYIGVTEDGDVIIKGMVGKKSNTPEFIKEEFKKAVKILASIQSQEDVAKALDMLRNHALEINRKIRKREYNLEEMAIRVMLSKDLKEYTKNTPQHVKAAMILKKHAPHMRFERGTIIAYVKTRDRIGVKPVALAKLSEIDTTKYLEYVRTAFEQMLLAFGVRWEELSGLRKLY
ncbi:MAG: DNA-directed DNA polymerase I [Desulfurococcales archaeon]|nr:DNA-directed DNA polymerase I [Desulfurococcales archaeon]